jgi:hypothetical protein
MQRVSELETAAATARAALAQAQAAAATAAMTAARRTETAEAEVGSLRQRVGTLERLMRDAGSAEAAAGEQVGSLPSTCRQRPFARLPLAFNTSV